MKSGPGKIAFAYQDSLGCEPDFQANGDRLVAMTYNYFYYEIKRQPGSRS